MAWDTLPTRESIDAASAALKEHGIGVFFFENRDDAKVKVLSLIPERAEIMNMTSMTLAALGLDKEILESGRYDSIRNRLNGMDRKTQHREMQMYGAAPPWVIGSVHAVTEDGSVMFASKTGSQLPAYASGSTNVIWVVGAQKIVKNIDEGFRRIYEHCLPLEKERARKAYGTDSSVNKILIIKEEIEAHRMTMVIINEVIGF